MAKIIYNPKYLVVEGKKTVNIADIKRFVWSHNYWNLKAGEMLKFPDDVGSALLRTYGFLSEVDTKNIKKVKDEIAEKLHKCDKCEFETNTAVAFHMHMKAHDKDKIIEIDGIEEAQPKGHFVKTGVVRMMPDKPEQQEGIPLGGTFEQPVEDKDGVGWYGEGLGKDTL